MERLSEKMLPKLMRSVRPKIGWYNLGKRPIPFKQKLTYTTASHVDSGEASVELSLSAKSFSRGSRSTLGKLLSSAVSNTAQPEFPSILLAQTML